MICRALVAALAVVGGASWADDAGKQPASPSKALSVGVMAALDDASATAQAKALAMWVKSASGHPAKERVFKDYEQLAAAVQKNEVDVALMGPLAYLRIDPKSGATLLGRTVRKGKSTYRAVLFAKPNSPLKNLEALKKAKSPLKVGWVDTSSATGYVIPKAHLLVNKLDPVQIFTVQDFAGSHDAVCNGVMDGKWDVGATFSNDAAPAPAKANGCENALGKKAETLTVIAATDEVPNDVLVAAPTISKQLADVLSGDAKKLSSTDVGQKTLTSAFLAEGVVDVTEADFAPVRKALEAFSR